MIAVNELTIETPSAVQLTARLVPDLDRLAGNVRALSDSLDAIANRAEDCRSNGQALSKPEARRLIRALAALTSFREGYDNDEDEGNSWSVARLIAGDAVELSDGDHVSPVEAAKRIAAGAVQK